MALQTNQFVRRHFCNNSYVNCKCNVSSTFYFTANIWAAVWNNIAYNLKNRGH